MKEVTYLIVYLLLVFLGCKKASEEKLLVNPETVVDTDSIGPGEIKMIDNYPLYYMNYGDDYRFERYLTNGNSHNIIEVRELSEKNNWACSCFMAAGSKDSIFFGRNFDFFHRSSLLLHTSPPNAFSSYSMVDLFYCGFSGTVGYQELLDNRDKLKKAPFRPLDGVNERGVAIGLMAVSDAKPPYDSGKVSLFDLALIRLVLDYAENTEHAITLLSQYNYEVADPPVHFLIADKQGKAAIVEYVDNDLKITRNSVSFMVSTNFIVYNSGAPLNVTCDRYAKAYSTLKQNSGTLSKIKSLELLRNISQEITMWSLVYDLNDYNSIKISVGRNYDNIYNFRK